VGWGGGGPAGVGGGGGGGGGGAPPPPPRAAHALAVACPAVAGSLSGKTMIGRTSTEP
jgi:hypothetical protein